MHVAEEIPHQPCSLLFMAGSSQDDDVTVVFSDSIVRIVFQDLETAVSACLRGARDSKSAASQEAGTTAKSRQGLFGTWGVDAKGSGKGDHTAADHRNPSGIAPLPFQRWELPRAVQSCTDAVCLGEKQPDLYWVLQQQGATAESRQQRQLLYCVAAESPSLCSVVASRQAGRGTLALLQGLASSLGSVTSGAVGRARTAASSIASTPASITSGLRSLVLAPFTSTSQGMSSSQSNDKPGPYAEAPVATFDGRQQRAEAAAMAPRAFRDEGRVVTRLCPAPRGGSLIAATDNLGRVLLVEGAHMCVLRLWKVGHASVVSLLPTRHF